MLSYQHIYHAGNAADVQKHLWLVSSLQFLKKQKRPVTWLDTHAGRGLYDLSCKEAQRLGEYKTGFRTYRDKRQHAKELDDAEKTYLKLVADLNQKRRGLYPGSALITAQLLDKSDKLALCELHKGEIEHLKKALAPYKNTKIHKQSGYDLLSDIARQAPSGGVLIDPSYEVKSEYEQVLQSVTNALALWPTGLFLIWYPLLPAGHHMDIVKGFQSLKTSYTQNIQIEECQLRPAGSGERGLYGTGMIIINGPKTSFRPLLETTLAFK